MSIKKLLIFILPFLLISMVIADTETLPRAKYNQCVDLPQTCSNCTYSNISTIRYPNGVILYNETAMTKRGISYNYTLCRTNYQGDYIVCGHSDVDGIDTIWCYTQPIGIPIWIFLIIGLITYIITLIGFFGKNIPLTILGGIMMIAVGVYGQTQGVIIYGDVITEYLTIFTWAVGAICSLWAIGDWIGDM